ncbi:MAG: AzlC family ABC transporter permease [Clostridia bacterium]|nr:AzlC family ABC transporter permease [Clostridia bacterium]
MSTPKISKRKQYLYGLRAGLPVIFGFIPVGIAFAIMARQEGFSILQTCAMSLSVFAGASQMMSVGMYAQGASIIAIIVATFILNLRHVIMSTCVAERMPKLKLWQKFLAGFGVTDESFAIFTAEKKEKCTVWFFFGMITVTYSSWNIGTLIGAVASNFLPDILTASFGVALYAMFIGLLVPNLTRNWRLGVLVVMTAVCNTLFNLFMDQSWALIASTLLCAAVGVFFVDLKEEESSEKAKSDESGEVLTNGRN